MLRQKANLIWALKYFRKIDCTDKKRFLSCRKTPGAFFSSEHSLSKRANIFDNYNVPMYGKAEDMLVKADVSQSSKTGAKIFSILASAKLVRTLYWSQSYDRELQRQRCRSLQRC
jgi:hypothetical protein